MQQAGKAAGSVTARPAVKPPAAALPATINNVEFVGQDLSGHDFAKKTLRNVNFDHCALVKADLTRATFVGCTFNAAILTRATLKGARFEDCQFSRAALDQVDAQQSAFVTGGTISYDQANNSLPELDSVGTIFEHATLSGANFTGASLVRANFSDVQALKANFRDAKLQRASFDRCTLAGASFFGAQLEGADFSLCADARSVLPESALRVVTFFKRLDAAALESQLSAHQRWIASNGAEGERLLLRAVDLFRHNFRDRDLSGSDFRSCRLDQASFQGCRLIAADFRDASLGGTVFRACDLRGAKIDSKAITKVRLLDSRL
jgi:uncharacterized protein YjbI with pentapeptide repeats